MVIEVQFEELDILENKPGSVLKIICYAVEKKKEKTTSFLEQISAAGYVKKKMLGSAEFGLKDLLHLPIQGSDVMAIFVDENGYPAAGSNERALSVTVNFKMVPIETEEQQVLFKKKSGPFVIKSAPSKFKVTSSFGSFTNHCFAGSDSGHRCGFCFTPSQNERPGHV
jgi:hypothetical protein